MKKYDLFEDDKDDLLKEAYGLKSKYKPKKFILFGDEDDDKPKYKGLDELILNPYKGNPMLEQMDKDIKKSLKLMDEKFARRKERERRRDKAMHERFNYDRAGIPTLLDNDEKYYDTLE